jgi:two-component sensor histidine kinase
MRELEHRLGNTLAKVQSLARQSFPRALVPRELQAFEGRLMALAAAYRVLARGSWREASLRELVAAATASWPPEGRVALDGPAVGLLPEASSALAVALHELAADAARRGAGAVAVTWRPTPAGGVELRWEEAGGAPPAERAASMLDRLVRHQLDGTIDCRARPAGRVCRLTIGAAGIHHGD